jgi:AraC-like DNA-binding protein/mannose-6-phosphate isomerase-like protein (cupin superfamily)
VSSFSQSRRDSSIVRSFRAELRGGSSIETHRHDWHQLVYASRGALEVTTRDRTWLVPSRRAIWVPAGVPHGFVALGRTLVETLYVLPEWNRETLAACAAIDVSDLLRSLVLEIARIGALDESNPAHGRLAGVLLDQVRSAELLELQIPMPADDRALAVARAILAEPSSKETPAMLARRAATSERTLARLFMAETGMTLARWRTQARFVNAVRALAGGTPIGEVAGDVGYESTSAFINAFKRVFGVTPGRYLND